MQIKLSLLLSTVLLLSDCRIPMDGSIHYQASSDTFTSVDNISYTLNKGDIYNTGKINLPFDTSLNIDGNTLDYAAMLNVTITPPNNTTGGTLSTKIDFTRVEGGSELTKSYSAGERVDQKVNLITSSTTF